MDIDIDIEDAINSNPISYFLTPSNDIEAYDIDFTDLSAGIEGSPSSSTFLPQDIREVSPSSLQRLSTYPEDDYTAAFLDNQRRLANAKEREVERKKAEEEMAAWLAAPMSLRDFTNASSTKRKSSGSRGRGVVRLSPTSSSRGTGTRGSGKRRASSYSSPRPHSWREPSPEIGSIQEEEEDYQDAVMGHRDETPGLMSDTLTEGEEPVVQRKKAKVEGKGKRVRWAMPERWDIDC